MHSLGTVECAAAESMERSRPCCAAASKARHVPVHPDEYRLLRRQAESWQSRMHRQCASHADVDGVSPLPGRTFPGFGFLSTHVRTAELGEHRFDHRRGFRGCHKYGEEESQEINQPQRLTAGESTAPQQGPIKRARQVSQSGSSRAAEGRTSVEGGRRGGIQEEKGKS